MFCFSFYKWTYYENLILRHDSVLQFSWLLNRCSRGIILYSHSYSKPLFLLFFIIHPQLFLSCREFDLMHPYWSTFTPLKTTFICFATSFNWWEVSTRKYGCVISLSSFTLDEFITWNWETLSIWLSTSQIVFQLSVKMN